MAKNIQEAYGAVAWHWIPLEGLVLGAGDHAMTLSQNFGLQDNTWIDSQNAIEQMMFLETVTSLSDTILTKVDRASMASSLETRVPFLDHHLVENILCLPFSYKVRGRERKWLLRQVLKKYLPLHLVNRPKAGFDVPLEHWLRGPLRDWAHDLLTEKKLEEEGFLNTKRILEVLKKHMKGEINAHLPLWDVLMFESWLESQKA